jgi:hypothetical protein
LWSGAAVVGGGRATGAPPRPEQETYQLLISADHVFSISFTTESGIGT